MNIPALEALEDVRFIMSLGATFGGKEGRPYIDALFATAWDAQDTVDAATEMLDAADAKRDQARDRPGE